jgi:hypothetical protein
VTSRGLKQVPIPHFFSNLILTAALFLNLQKRGVGELMEKQGIK